MKHPILSLLRCLIDGDSPPHTSLPLLRKFALVPSINLWLTQAPDLISRLPDTLRQRLKAKWYQRVALTRLRQRELSTVLASLHHNNIEATLLKGAAFLGGGLYPHPALRPMGDLDLWIPPGQMTRALKVLFHLGYTPVHKRRPLALYMHYAQEIEVRGTRPGTSVIDLHYQPFQGWWAILATRLPRSLPYQRLHTSQINDIPVHVLSPEAHLLHIAFHFAINHHLGSPGIQALIDLAVSLRAWPVNWSCLVAQARAWHVRTVLWSALYLLQYLGDDLVPAAVMNSLCPPGWQRALLRLLLPKPGALLFPRTNNSRARYLFHLLLCDSPRFWPRLFAWALWPEQEWLRLRYGRATTIQHVHHIWCVLSRPLS